MWYFIMVSIHLLSCILLVITVLLQSGRDAGLSGAFGLGGGSQTIFGARAGDVMSKATIVIAVVFVISCLAFTKVQRGTRSVVEAIPEEVMPEGKVSLQETAPLSMETESEVPATDAE